MTGQPKNLRRDGGGEATVAPEAHGTWGAIKRHRKNTQRLCSDCAEYQRTYNRSYYQQARNIDTFRQRHNARHRQSMRLAYTDPAKVASINARRRQRRQEAALTAREAARIDEVVVARLVDGEPVPHNRTERLEAVRQLRTRGFAYNEVAERLRISARQVHRDLADLGLVNSTGEVA